MLNGWNRTVRTTSAIKSASMMTLTVSHQPSSFLAGVTAASADFTVGSIIRLNTPFLVSSEDRRPRPAAPPIQGRSACAKRSAGDAKTWRKQGRGSASRHEKQGAGRFALLERNVGLRRLPREASFRPIRILTSPRPTTPKQIARHFLGPRAIRHEGDQGRPGGEQRALLRQKADVERFDAARGGAEAGEHAKRPQAIERRREGRLADAVIDHMAFRALGDLARPAWRNPPRDRGSCASRPPSWRARPFPRVPTQPITVAPSALPHWHRMSPTPPAAAWTRIVSPSLTR